MLKTFLTPINSAAYLASVPVAHGVFIRHINYDTGEVAFSLVGPSNVVSPVVNGITVPGVSEDAVADAVAAVLAGE